MYTNYVTLFFVFNINEEVIKIYNNKNSKLPNQNFINMTLKVN